MMIHMGNQAVIPPSPQLDGLPHYSRNTTASQTWLCKQMTWGSCQNVDSDPGGLGWGMRLCISNKLPGCAAAAGWDWTLSRGCQAVEATGWPSFTFPFAFSSLPSGLTPQAMPFITHPFFFPFSPFKTVNMSILLHFEPTMDVHSFIHSLSKHFLSQYFVPGTELHMSKI